jgi:hypothetical protein
MAYSDFLQALALVDPENFDRERILADAKREHEEELSIRDAKIAELTQESAAALEARDAEMRKLKSEFYDKLMKTPVDPAGNAGNPAEKGSQPTGGSGDDEVVEASFESLMRKE